MYPRHRFPGRTRVFTRIEYLSSIPPSVLHAIIAQPLVTLKIIQLVGTRATPCHVLQQTTQYPYKRRCGVRQIHGAGEPHANVCPVAPNDLGIETRASLHNEQLKPVRQRQHGGQPDSNACVADVPDGGFHCQGPTAVYKATAEETARTRRLSTASPYGLCHCRIGHFASVTQLDFRAVNRRVV